MMARGKAALGDKTVLDALDAAAGAAEGKSEPAEILQAALHRGGRDAGADARHAGEDRPRAYLRRAVCRAG